MRGAPLALGIAALVGPSALAHADPGTQAVSVSLGYATFSIPIREPRPDGPRAHSPDGTSLALDYELGLTEVVFLRASGGGGVYFGEQLNYSGQATIGLTYHLDVLRWVPYVSVGAGGIVIGGGEISTDLHPLVELGGGVDVSLSEGFSLGLLGRVETLLNETSYFSAGARMSFAF